MLKKYSPKLRNSSTIAGIIWTIIVFVSAYWNTNLYNNMAEETALADARTSYNKDVEYRRWVSIQGGVYVAPTDKVLPNPYLMDLPERDVTTTTGKNLTLVNPAYFVRMVHENADSSFGLKGHITSLNPLNPKNKPDGWEISALISFNNGNKEYSSIIDENGQKYLRLMKPLLTEYGCLKCHGKQGYKEGDIRGGISVKVPLAKYLASANTSIKSMLYLHGLIYILGLLALIIAGQKDRKNKTERDKITLELLQNKEAVLSQKKVLDAIFENSPYIMALVDEDARVININRPGLQLSGKNVDELKGELAGAVLGCINSFSELGCGKYPDCSKCQIRNEIKKTLETGQPAHNTEVNITFVTQNGPAVYDILLSTGLLYMDDGKKTILITLADITEQKQAERIVKENKDKFESLFELTPQAIAITDIETAEYLEINHAFEEMTGFSKNELIKKTANTLGFWKFPEKRSHWLAQVIENGKIDELDALFINRNGQNIKASLTSRMINLSGRKAILTIVQDITARKETEEMLRGYEQKMSLFIKQNPLAVIEWDANFIVKEWNLAAEQIFGYTREEALGKQADFIVYEEVLDSVSKVRASLLKNTGGRRTRNENITKDGKVIVCEWYNTRLYDMDDNVTGVVSIAQDVTDSIKTDLEIRKNRNMLDQILNSIPHAVFWKDVNSVYLGCNEVFANDAGLNSTTDIIGKTDAELPWSKSDTVAYIEDDKKVMNGKKPIYHITERILKGGKNLSWIDTSKIPLKDINGNIIGILGLYEDITERKIAEAQQKFLLDTINSSYNELYIFDAETLKFEFANKGALNNLGYTMEQLKEITPLDLKPEISSESFKQIIAPLLKKEKTVISFETVHKRADGTLYPIEVHMQLFNRGDKKVFLSVIINLSEKRKAEDNLEKSEERFLKVFQANPSAISITRKADGKIMDVNGSFSKIFNYSREEMIGRDVFELGLLVDINDHFEMVKQMESYGRVVNFEIKMRNKQKQKLHILISTENVDINGELCTISIMTDITEKNQSEQLLKASEEKYRTLYETMAQGVVYQDSQGYIISANKAAEQILGLSLREMQIRTSENKEWDAIYEDGTEFPGNKHPAMVALRKGVQISGVVMGVYNYKEKERKWILLNSTPQFRNDEPYPYQVYTTFFDITERKLSEEALKKSEERFSTIFNSSPVSMAITRLRDNKLIEINREWLRISGYQLSDALEKTTLDLKMWADVKEREFMFESMKNSNSLRNFEFNMRTKDGRILNMNMTSEKIELAGELCLLSVGVDITMRKQIERDLKENREKMEAILNAIPDFMFVFSKDGTFLDFHVAEERFLMQDGKYFINKNIAEVMPADIAQLTIEKIKTTMDTGVMQTFEYVMDLHGNKSFEARLVPCSNDSFLAIVRDVTKSKKDEEEIKKSLKEKEILLKELYHRTKNNMQVISAMIQLQAVAASDPNLVRILSETSNRIKTMSLVHQKLYQSKDLSKINLREYITELIELLVKLYNIDRKKIMIKLDLEDQFLLIDYAVPCGLVINEIVSNTFKYAFPNDRKGQMEIKMRRNPDGEVKMNFHDNGIGLPPSFDPSTANTLGMQLIHNLIEHQLDGKLEIISDNGLSVNISFYDNQYGVRV